MNRWALLKRPLGAGGIAQAFTPGIAGPSFRRLVRSADIGYDRSRTVVGMNPKMKGKITQVETGSCEVQATMNPGN
jgi:hypothetical protein